MTEDTIFAIASMTKPITCVGVMRLVEQGKLGLDDPVSKYLPELKDLRVLGDAKDDTENESPPCPPSGRSRSRPALAHLGILLWRVPDEQRPPGEELRWAGVQGRELKTIAEQVGAWARPRCAHQPGEGWTYGLSHDVLGRLIEVVSGQSFDIYLHDHIFTPLDMHDTFFFVPEAKRYRVATIYRANETRGSDAAAGELRLGDVLLGGGGLFSTARITPGSPRCC